MVIHQSWEHFSTLGMCCEYVHVLSSFVIIELVRWWKSKFLEVGVKISTKATRMMLFVQALRVCL
jgi:hypothetical protein